MANFTAGTTLASAALNAAFNQADINAQTGTTYGFVLSDQGKLVTLSNSSAQTITVPLASSVNFPTGTVISLLSLGAGLVTVQGAGGVTLNPSSATLSQYEAASLVNIATNSWIFVRGGFPKAVVSSSTASSVSSVTSGGLPAKVYRFTGTGSITLSSAGMVDCLLQGPGGVGSDGAGGAGGLVIHTNVLLPLGATTVYIGGGQAYDLVQGNRESSIFRTFVATGGGGGAQFRDRQPSGGACGGGSGAFASGSYGAGAPGMGTISYGSVTRGGHGAGVNGGGGGGVSGDGSGATGGAGFTPGADWGSPGLLGRGGGGATMAANTGNGGNFGNNGNSGLVLVRVFD
jgi:hypothetical protein